MNINMENSIKNKILHDLNLIWKINNTDLTFNILDKINMPDYSLYELTILNRENLGKKINYTMRINNFLNSNEYKIIEIEVLTAIPANNSIKINKKVRIIYTNDHIEICDTGIIQKIINNRVIVKNSFGKSLNCKVLYNDLVEVEAAQ